MENDAIIAYFSMEFGTEDIPYAGGLGELAGSYMKACADLGLPVVGVGLLYNQGNFHQKLLYDEQKKEWYQTEWYDRFDPTGRMKHRHTNVTVPIEGRDVKLNSWEYSIVGENGIVPLHLLDTEGNNLHRPWDDNICCELYPSGDYQRLTQEQVLGTGGVRTLRNLKFPIQLNHINEGHPALAGVELIRKYGSLEEARKHIVFTTHTPVQSGFDIFSKERTEQVLGQENYSLIKDLNGIDYLHMTKLAMISSSKSFGVSPLHAQVSRYILKDFHNIEKLFSKDNGVHIPTWASPEIQKLYESLTNGLWKLHPETLEKVLEISDEEAWNVRKRSRERLGEFLYRDPRVKWISKDESKRPTYDPEKITIGDARRFTGYKQPTLIFDDLNRLKKLGKDIQIIFSGKAHPRDEYGKGLIKDVFRYMEELEGYVPIWFIEDDDMQITKFLVRGVDLWLNTPMRLLEASGSSGMKAAINGVPQLSIPDGWWMTRDTPKGYTLPKGAIEGVTGWVIGRMPDKEDFQIFLNDDEKNRERRQQDRKNDAKSLLDKLEYEISPLFKHHKTSSGADDKSWAKVIKGAISHNASYFNSIRMAKEYFNEVYIPLLEENETKDVDIEELKKKVVVGAN